MLLNYTKALGSINYKHFVYCFGPDGPVKRELEKLGVTVLIGPKLVSIKNPIFFFKRLIQLFFDLSHNIKKFEIKVLQSHNGQSNKIAIVIGKLSELKVLPTIHSTKAFEDNRFLLDPRVILRKSLDFFLLQFSNYIIAVSDEIKNIIIKTYKINEKKIFVIKNGIVYDYNKKNQCFRFQNNRSTNEKIKIISVGRLNPLKNFDTIIRAGVLLKKELNDNFEIWIVGEEKKESNEKERLQNLINDLKLQNKVKLLGIRNDVLELLKISDIFVLASSYEGLSVAMIEAMASGLPIVASNAPGIKDFISDYENGLLFPIKDHKILSKKIVQLIEDKKLMEKLSIGAKNSFFDNYNMCNNILPLLQILN